MKVVLFANGWVGWKIAEALRQSGDEMVGLVMHPQDKRKFGEELRIAAGLTEAYLFDGSQLAGATGIDEIRSLQPEIGVSAFFGYRIPEELLRVFPLGCVNIHPSMLPHNRGAHPNFWSIVNRTPSGVTIHYMDRDFDTGPIIAQDLVPIEPIDTGKSLYHRLELACLNLFTKTWPQLRAGAAPLPNDRDAGSSHRVRDLQAYVEIDMSRTYTARELIDILRAATFPPYPGAHFSENGKKVYMRLNLSYEVEPE